MTKPDPENNIIGRLGRAFPPTEADLTNLRARLVAYAERADLLDVAYRTIDSVVGTLLLAATPIGLVRVGFERQGFNAILEELAAQISPRVLAAPRRLDPAARQLEEYFAHRRLAFDLPIDLRLAVGFRRQVVVYLPAIQYGHTASYASVAAAVKNPKAVRAVGSACARNPLPLVIPCHRVIRSDGALGEYAGGTDNKRHLLELEAAA